MRKVCTVLVGDLVFYNVERGGNVQVGDVDVPMLFMRKVYSN